jgi:hypothetical protein
MHRIDTAGNVNGKFTDGNPQTGQEATLVSDAWLNDVQENLLAPLTAAGIAPIKGNGNQLLDAIISLIAGVVGSGGGSVPTTRLVSGAGLITGGGSLAVDQTLTLLKMLPADVIAGTRDDGAITPLGLAQALTGTNNVLSLPGGWILQKGQLIGSYSEGSIFMTLPTSFTTTDYVLSLTAINQAGNSNADIHMQRVSKSLGNFTAFFNYDGNGGNVINGFEYIAIGK